MTFPENTPLIGVCGAGACDEHTAALAREVGRLIAHAGGIVITGGLGGVMEAASRGAREAGGITVGILPGDSTEAANPYITVPIATGMGESRNVVIILTSGSVIAIGGEYGTLSEIALARKRRKLVVGLNTWDLGEELDGTPRLIPVESPEEAVRLALAAARER